MQENTFYADETSNGQNRQSHHLSVQLITTILPLVIIGMAVGSLVGLQWAGQRGITLGYPQPQVRIAALSTTTLIRNQDYPFSATGHGRELSYFWDFGDQSGDIGTNVHHIYQSNGTFVVSVTVTDPANHQVMQSEIVTVVPPAPQASFSFYYGYAGSVSFDASNSIADSSTSIASYNWDFGDGSTPESTSYPQVSHYYNYVGAYHVKLTVTDSTGQTSIPYTIIITIS